MEYIFRIQHEKTWFFKTFFFFIHEVLVQDTTQVLRVWAFADIKIQDFIFYSDIFKV